MAALYVKAFVMLLVAGALAPSASTRTYDGLKSGDDALKTLEDTASVVVANLAVTKRVTQEMEDTLVYLAPQYKADLSVAFTLQKATTAAEKMLLTIDETTHFMELVQTFETRDEANTDFNIMMTSTWVAYLAMVLAAAAPLAAHWVAGTFHSLVLSSIHWSIHLVQSSIHHSNHSPHSYLKPPRSPVCFKKATSHDVLNVWNRINHVYRCTYLS